MASDTSEHSPPQEKLPLQWETISKEEFFSTLKALKPGDEYPYDLVWITYVPQEGQPYPQLRMDTDVEAFIRHLRALFEKEVRASGSAYQYNENGHLFSILPDELTEPLAETVKFDLLKKQWLPSITIGERYHEAGKDRVGDRMQSVIGHFPLVILREPIRVVRRRK